MYCAERSVFDPQDPGSYRPIGRLRVKADGIGLCRDVSLPCDEGAFHSFGTGTIPYAYGIWRAAPSFGPSVDVEIDYMGCGSCRWFKRFPATGQFDIVERTTVFTQDDADALVADGWEIEYTDFTYDEPPVPFQWRLIRTVLPIHIKCLDVEVTVNTEYWCSTGTKYISGVYRTDSVLVDGWDTTPRFYFTQPDAWDELGHATHWTNGPPVHATPPADYPQSFPINFLAFTHLDALCNESNAPYCFPAACGGCRFNGWDCLTGGAPGLISPFCTKSNGGNLCVDVVPRPGRTSGCD